MAHNRYENALLVQQGACNPSGIAKTIYDMCAEIRAEPDHGGTEQIRNDPAIRLLVHQLAYLCKVSEIDDSLTLYGELMEQCKAKSSAEIVAMCKS